MTIYTESRTDPGLEYRDLSAATSVAMAAELERDLATGVLFISPRLTPRAYASGPTCFAVR